MKRISLICVALAVCLPAVLRAQDAATEEKLNRLSGQIDNLIESQRAQQKHMEALAKAIDALREQMDKPSSNYASAEDLKQLANALKEVDRKRLEDYDKIRDELLGIRKGLLSAPPPPPRDSPRPSKPEKGFEHTVQSGQTLSAIIQAYHDHNVNVTLEQIKKANPGLNPDKIYVGQKIWIPAP